MLNLAFSRLPILPGKGLVYKIILVALPGLLLLAVFYLIYQSVPRRRVSNRAAITEAVLALILFAVALPVFLGYGVILLFGGQVVSHMQDIVIRC